MNLQFCRTLVLVIGAALFAGCATSDIRTADISAYYQVRTAPASLLSRQHAQIFVKSKQGDYEYLASIRDPGWAERFPLGFSGLRAANVAISSDGSSIVYEHNSVLAGKKSQKASGLYRHEYGMGERLLLKNDEFAIPARGYPKPLPPDVIVISRWKPGESMVRSTTEAVAASGDIAPALLLGGTSLHRAAFDGDVKAVAQTVRDHGESLNALTYWEMTALEVAVLARKEAVARQLLMLGASYHETKDEKSLIFLASAYRSPLIVNELLKRNTSFQFTVTDGITPFHALLRFYSPDTLFLPVDRVTDLESFVSTLDVYMKHGTDINLRDGKGRTLLHLAAEALPADPSASVVAHLIDKGIDAELTDKEGNTALHQAVAMLIGERDRESWEQQKLPVIRVIAGRMKSVDVKNDQGVSPLQRAVQGNFIRTAEYLIAHGADATVEFIHGGMGPKVPGQSIQERIESVKAGEWWKGGAK